MGKSRKLMYIFTTMQAPVSLLSNQVFPPAKTNKNLINVTIKLTLNFRDVIKLDLPRKKGLLFFNFQIHRTLNTTLHIFTCKPELGIAPLMAFYSFAYISYSTANVPPSHQTTRSFHNALTSDARGRHFLPWFFFFFAKLACWPDCLVSGIFINSTHIASDRITALFVDRALWPPNIKCLMFLSKLTPVFHSKALIFPPTSQHIS